VTRPLLAVLLLAVAAHSRPAAQDVSKEYRVKAAFLYNFVKFVEWPARTEPGPIVICVAGRNPFDSILDDTIRGETVRGRSLTARVILEPDPACHVTFVPTGANAVAYLRAARGTPMLTVGESLDFIQQGGLIRFYLDGGTVRFEINRDGAERAGVRISSRLLQLARLVPAPPETR
jgi:hypothetical protein